MSVSMRERASICADIASLESMRELEKSREYSVVKDNALIQKSRYELSLVEQKTIAYICSKIIKAPDAMQLEYEFDIREYCKVCGIEYNSGKNYENVKATLKKLSDRSMWVVFENNPDEEVLCRWLSRVRTNKKSGKVNIKIDEYLAPYLFQLGEKFTQYQLIYVLEMKSAFSFRIYEILKSYEWKKMVDFDLDELKKMLCVENVKSYKNFNLFKTKVLEKAQEEINGHTDISFTYLTRKKGKKVVGIKFIIGRPSALDIAIIARDKSDRLNKK